MITKYGSPLDGCAVKDNLMRIGNQIFKLLPLREEEKDWQKPLETLTLEVLGMSSLFSDQRDLVSLACKLEGILVVGSDMEFYAYRRAIFECCSIVDRLKGQCQ